MAKNSKFNYLDAGHLKSNLRKSAFQGAAGAVFSQVSVYLIQMVGVIFLSRLLTPDDFGLVTMVTSIDVFVRMFRNLGLMDAIVQREEITQKQVSTLFWINSAFGLFLTLFFMAMAPLIAWFYNEPRLLLISIFLSLDYVFGGISTQHRALLKRNLQMYRWAANEIAATAISFGVSIILAWQGWGYWAIVGRVIAFAVLQAAGSWIFCQWRPGLPALRTGIRPMLIFGRNMLGKNFLNFFAESIDKILIGRFNGPNPLGHYSRAYHLFLAPAQQLTVPLTSVAVATLSRMQDDPEKYRRYFLNAFTMLAFVGFPISAVLTLTGKSIIFLLLGPQWEEAGNIFCVFGVGIGIHILYATHTWLFMSIDRTGKLLRWSVFASLIITISFFIGLPFGPIGMAAAYTISIHILIGPAMWYAGKPIGLKLSSLISATWKYYASALFAGLICWFVLYSFDSTSAIYGALNVFLRIVSASVFYAFIYLLMIVVLFQSTKPISQFFINVRYMMPSVSLKK
jgi:O-antigen/teichoic acid export membrane protein